MARPDFRVKTFFTPQFIPGLGMTQGWKDAFELASLNITIPGVDTIPAAHQYIVGQDFASGLRAPCSYIEISKHLTQGSFATVIIESQSDRDFFEVVPNETVSVHAISGATNANPIVITDNNHQLDSGTNIRITGVQGMTELNNRSFRIAVNDANHYHLHAVGTLSDIDGTGYGTYTSSGQVAHGGGDMMPRIKFPYRAWEVNLKAKDDGAFPTVPLFRGMRTRVQAVVIGDKKITNTQDKLYRWIVELRSFDAWNLQNDKGVAVWYHRANNTTDSYHLAFDTGQHITFDTAITRVVAWMNQGRPTTDFPITYAYTEKLSSPYNKYLDAVTFDPSELTIAETQQASTWEVLTKLLNYMGAIEGLGNKYVPTLTVNAAGTTGTIDTVLGGYDKTHTFNEAVGDTDFRTFTTMEYYNNGGSHVPTNALGNGVLMSAPLNEVKVAFDINNPGEYWIQFKLWKWSGSVWETVVTLPATGYEYVEYDGNNVHNSKEFTFPAQPSGSYYTWTAELVCANPSFIIASSGSGAYGVAAYALQASNSEQDVTTLRTFVMTRGNCQYMRDVDNNGSYISNTAAICPDFYAGLCPGHYGLYPDPITSSITTLTGTLLFSLNSTAVVGTGTSFTTELQAGDLIRVKQGSVYHEVYSVTDNLNLVLSDAFSDPCYAGNLTGTGVKAGSTTSNETVNPTYGIIAGELTSFANVSSAGVNATPDSWNTLCRLDSKRKYECSLNTASKIREPLNIHLEFVDGWTGDVVGKYCKYTEPITDEEIMFRCIQQTHILQAGRLKTVVEGLRV